MKNFLAYGSGEPLFEETLEQFAEEINENNDFNSEIISWKEASQGGEIVLNEICNKIDDANNLICDISSLNNNVIFEIEIRITLKFFIIKFPALNSNPD